jgi:hypothetical protein
MKAAAVTTLAIAGDPRRLGARIGVTAVLHTWGSTLTHHPHVFSMVKGRRPFRCRRFRAPMLLCALSWVSWVQNGNCLVCALQLTQSSD